MTFQQNKKKIFWKSCNVNVHKFSTRNLFSLPKNKHITYTQVFFFSIENEKGKNNCFMVYAGLFYSN